MTIKVQFCNREIKTDDYWYVDLYQYDKLYNK